MMSGGRARVALLTVHHLFAAALVLKRAHLVGHLMTKAPTDVAMVIDLHLLEVFHPVVVRIPVVHLHATWIRSDQLRGSII